VTAALTYLLFTLLVAGAVGAVAYRAGVRRAKQSLQGLARFRAATDVIDEALYVIDRATLRVVDATAFAARKAGFSREALLQKSVPELLRTNRDAVDKEYDEAIAAGSTGITKTQSLVTVHGTVVTTEAQVRAFNFEGRCLIVAVSRDVTQKTLAEQAAVRLTRLYAALSATNEAIMRVTTPQDLYQRVCDAAVDGGKFLGASVCLPHADAEHASIAAVAGDNADGLRNVRISLAADTPAGSGLVGTAFRSIQPAVSNDFMHDERTRYWHEQAGAAGILAGAALPLVPTAFRCARRACNSFHRSNSGTVNRYTG
jgi:PAS domain S-box-containing protein